MTEDLIFSPDVAVSYNPAAQYSEKAPFNPPESYPELSPFEFPSDPTNKVYGMVRESFHLLELDKENFGTPVWNPFASFIRPGDKVVIKPNAVCHLNRADTVFASITHPSVIRVIIDYCLLALKGDGTITIADCPIMSSDFEKWKEHMHVKEILEFYRQKTSIELRCLDLRQTYVKWTMGYTPAHTRQEVNLDPLGYTMVNLRHESAFSTLTDKETKRIYGADDVTKETIGLHSDGNHQYEVANTFLDADVLISVPKLKVHKKVGITLNIKGMVGTIGNKNSIPHFRRHSPDHGGDEYPDSLPAFQKLLNRYRMFLMTRILARHHPLTDLIYLAFDLPRRISEKLFVHNANIYQKMGGGSWHGNDTAWRMGADLIRIALYGRKDQPEITRIPRRFFSVIDGITGGEDDGPLSPSARQAGVIVSGFNPVAVDWTASRLINFNPEKIRMLNSSKEDSRLSWTGSVLPVIRSEHEAIRTLWNLSLIHI